MRVLFMNANEWESKWIWLKSVYAWDLILYMSVWERYECMKIVTKIRSIQNAIRHIKLFAPFNVTVIWILKKTKQNNKCVVLQWLNMPMNCNRICHKIPIWDSISPRKKKCPFHTTNWDPNWIKAVIQLLHDTFFWVHLIQEM